MNFLEKDLEQIIFETDNGKLCERELLITGKKYRQLRIGNYGIADIVTFKRGYLFGEGGIVPRLSITVFELKQKEISANTYMQAVRYCKGISRYIIEYRDKPINLDFNIVLIGDKICVGDFCYATDFINNLEVYTYSYNIDGIMFKNENEYKLLIEGFTSKLKHSL